MQYDIVIIGSGMVGASLACALKNTSLRIAIIDALPHAGENDPRLIALTHGSCNLFKNLNIWPQLEANAEAIKQIHVSHKGHFGATRFAASEINLASLGYLIPAKYINYALETNLKQLTNVTVLRPATLKTISFEDKNEIAILTIETPSGSQTLTANLVIGADGTHSTLRELLKISTKVDDYNQSAIVTITHLSRSHQNIAYERFIKTGAIAMLPLNGQRCATIWTDTNETIANLNKLSDADFLLTLQNNFGYRLGQLKKIETRHHYSLKLILAEEIQKNNIILIGNAAHTLHPIAAQGFNLALQEVAIFIEKINESLTQPNVSSHAKKFALTMTMQHDLQQALTTNLQTIKSRINLSHYLPKLFTSDFFILNITRQFGLFSLDACVPIKRLFLQKAMGQSGKIPSLLREKDHHEYYNTQY